MSSRLEQLLLEWMEADPKPSIDTLCSTCPELREELSRQIEALQRIDAGLAGLAATSSGTSEHPAPPDRAFSSRAFQADDRFLEFTILRTLGEGGMGTVYAARQERLHRDVALKVILPHRLTESYRRRFEFEWQALSLLDDPAIARLYDAGIATTDGLDQPYFVMELVDGERLDDYLKNANPNRIDRVKLLIAIARAVQAAHAHGIVHRDLKPANILITPRGLPKVIDFGVARIIDENNHGRHATAHTATGQFIGTLLYASPEQVGGDSHRVDIRCDVHALGVIGFEMLAGKLPYDIRGKNEFEAIRILQHDEPSRMGTSDRSLRGDLETIIGKALEKDRTRRYATADAFAEDLQAYLDSKPITARAPSTWYNVRKFAKRNKGVVGATVAILFALSLATGISLAFAKHARQQQRLAEQAEQSVREALARAEASEKLAGEERRLALARAAEATAVQNFLETDVFSMATPDWLPEKSDRDVILKWMIRPAATRVLQTLNDQPEMQVAMAFTLSRTMLELGSANESLPLIEHALDTSLRLYGPSDDRYLRLKLALSNCQDALGQPNLALSTAREIVDECEKSRKSDDALLFSALHRLAIVLGKYQNPNEAISILTDVAERCQNARGPLDPLTLNVISTLAQQLQDNKQYDKSAILLENLVRDTETVFGKAHPRTLTAKNNLATQFGRTGQPTKAVPILRELLQQRRVILGDDDPTTLVTAINLASVLFGTRQLDESAEIFQDIANRSKRIFGPDANRTIEAIERLALARMFQRNYSDAEELFRQSIQSRLKNNNFSATTFQVMASYFNVLLESGRFKNAEYFSRYASDQAILLLGEQHPTTIVLTVGLGIALAVQEKSVDAEDYFFKALAMAEKTSDRKLIAATAERYYTFLSHQNRPADAQLLMSRLSLPIPPVSPFVPASDKTPQEEDDVSRFIASLKVNSTSSPITDDEPTTSPAR